MVEPIKIKITYHGIPIKTVKTVSKPVVKTTKPVKSGVSGNCCIKGR